MVSSPLRRRSLTVGLIVAVFAVVVGVFAWTWLAPAPAPPVAPVDDAPTPTGSPEPEPPSPDPAPEDDQDQEPDRWPLTGVEVVTVPARPAVVVKVSNSPEARPQTGLDQADVVIEELVEFGITRFMAVFHSQLPEVVGPVRSARPVDVQLASGFGRPGFVYSGARAEVDALIVAAPFVAITEGAPGFFRDDGRYASNPYAPHDLFATVEPALSAIRAGGARPLNDLGWRFDERPPAGGRTATDLQVTMSSRNVTSWTYDAADGVYRRAQNGVPTLVTGTGRIGAANVVVLDTRHYVGASGYPETDLIGTGDATVLRDGRRYDARWAKGSAGEPLQLFDARGLPFTLAPGPTWIMLPDELPD